MPILGRNRQKWAENGRFFKKFLQPRKRRYGPQTFSRSKIWMRTACASRLGIVGEVYSELQGLQAWVVGQKKHTFQNNYY